MPRAFQHFIINAAVLTGAELLIQTREIKTGEAAQYDWGRLLLHVGAGVVAGAMPDVFEPSLGNPNHRGFCHSLSAALIVWWLASGRHTKELSPELRRLLTALAIGYTAHLGADLLFSRAKGMGFFNARF